MPTVFWLVLRYCNTEFVVNSCVCVRACVCVHVLRGALSDLRVHNGRSPVLRHDLRSGRCCLQRGSGGVAATGLGRGSLNSARSSGCAVGRTRTAPAQYSTCSFQPRFACRSQRDATGLAPSVQHQYTRTAERLGRIARVGTFVLGEHTAPHFRLGADGIHFTAGRSLAKNINSSEG
jgi:hypothetical protein